MTAPSPSAALTLSLRQALRHLYEPVELAKSPLVHVLALDTHEYPAAALRQLLIDAIEELKPAVPIRKSVAADYIICLEDGKKFKSLKRHLMTHYGMTPDQYREKWGLSADYPMVAPNYARARSDLAKKMGLGTRREK